MAIREMSEREWTVWRNNLTTTIFLRIIYISINKKTFFYGGQYLGIDGQMLHILLRFFDSANDSKKTQSSSFFVSSVVNLNNMSTSRMRKDRKANDSVKKYTLFFWVAYVEFFLRHVSFSPDDKFSFSSSWAIFPSSTFPPTRLANTNSIPFSNAPMIEKRPNDDLSIPFLQFSASLTLFFTNYHI